MIRRVFLTGSLLAALAAHAQPAPPAEVVTRAGDGSVVVRWTPVPGVVGYRVERSEDGGAFAAFPATRLAYWTDFDVVNGRAYAYRVASVLSGGVSSAPTAPVPAAPGVQADDAFLDLVARTAFDFFWAEANPRNGLVKDRSTPGSAASIASVGFGLTAYGVAADRGWVSRDSARARTRRTLEFLWSAEQSTSPTATGYRGFFYHFLDMTTGRRAGTCELSSIDTALLLGGVRYARQYYGTDHPDEARIRTLADAITDRVEWDWMTPRDPWLAMGWTPEGGFLGSDWRGYSEAMLLYLLAIGSDTHPIPASTWTVWTRNFPWESYFSARPYVPFPPLFGHQYSHVWVDFRGQQDAFMRARGPGNDYFENSRRATLAQRAYTTANPGGFRGYDADGWGITASDYPGGYLARGALPTENDEGTLAPTGPGGSYAFTPVESTSALRAFYARYKTTLWGAYGFRDAVNPTRNWTATDHLGIDQGPIVLMIENGRRDAVWAHTRRDSVLMRGLRRAGFQAVPTAADAAGDAVGTRLALSPAPARGAVRLLLTLAQPAPAARLAVFDALGRRVLAADLGALAPGLHEIPLDVSALAPGVYAVRLGAGGTVLTQRLVVQR